MEPVDASVENGNKVDNNNFGNGVHGGDSNAPAQPSVTTDDGCLIVGPLVHDASSSSSPSARNGAGYVDEGDKGMGVFSGISLADSELELPEDQGRKTL